MPNAQRIYNTLTGKPAPADVSRPSLRACCREMR